MSATTTQLLSSGAFCKLRYDTIPVKSASAKVFSIPVTQKCQILSCDTLVANERYIYIYIYIYIIVLFTFYIQDVPKFKCKTPVPKD